MVENFDAAWELKKKTKLISEPGFRACPGTIGESD